jgi:FkbM family methyltransferase
MKETVSRLKGDFIVLDLGAAHTLGLLEEAPGLTGAITLVEVDALLGETQQQASKVNRICLRKAVAGKRGKRVFKRRKFPECSSFLDPIRERVEAYGLQDYFLEVGSVELECETIAELLGEHGIKRVDLFKTDLEGMDFEVLASAPALVQQALCVQSELRFQPFFQGEPSFHEVAGYLAGLGFELICLRPAVWKYATPNRRLQRDGRTVWADTVFFLNPISVRERFGPEAWKCFAKQVILARLLGLGNFAEHLQGQAAAEFPEAVRKELARFVRPGFSLPRLVLAQINRLPLGWMVVGAARRLCRYGYRTAALYPDDHLGSVDSLGSGP